jgi:transposase-like protein
MAAPRLNSRWSKSDDAILTEMTKASKKTSDIAKVLGRTKASVWSRKFTLGLHDHRLSHSGSTDVPTTIGTKVRRSSLSRKYTDSFVMSVVSERERTNATYRTLSDKYGVPFQVIAGWCKKFGKKKQMKIEFPKTEPVKVDKSFDNVLKVGQEELIQKAAAIAKANGLKLTVLHFE